MSSHQTGAWIQQGSCSERRSMCLYTYDHSRHYLLHMFLANKIKLKFAQGHYNGKKKHLMIQGMVPSTLLFNHIQSSIREQLLNTCVGKIPVSTMSIFFAETLQTEMLSLNILVLKHNSPLFDDESVPVSLSPYAHTLSWLILWHFPPVLRHLVALSTTKPLFLNPFQHTFTCYLCSQSWWITPTLSVPSGLWPRCHLNLMFL